MIPSEAFRRIIPGQRERALIVGQTASGKSTLGAVLLEGYHTLYPRDGIYIIDPKHRFIPVGSTGRSLFPEGYDAKVHGRIASVSVCARLYRAFMQSRTGGVFLVQDVGQALELFQTLFERGDYAQPSLIYNDESLELHSNGLVDYRMRRINQEGRERGLGQITLTQRPKRIDQTFITESERVYIGRLTRKDDRKVMADNVVMDDNGGLMTPLDRHHFAMIDQVDYSRSIMDFTLNLG